MKVLILGSSGGLGAALAEHAGGNGWDVTGLSRRAHGFDITEPASVAAHLGALTGPFDAMIVATGALEIDGHRPEKSLRAIRADAMAAQFALNAVGPALALAHAGRLMPRDRRAVLGVLSARVGSIGDNRAGGWYGYRASKAALNQILRSAAIELARTHPQLICAALHPGTVATDMTRDYRGAHPAVPAATAARNLWSVLDSLTPSQSGGFFDWAGKPVPW